MAKTTAKTSVKKSTTAPAAVNDQAAVVAESVFVDPEMNLKTLAQVLIGQQNNQRHSNAHIKHRGEVAGTTKKPWRQKGTGRARVGTRRNPVWRGGGVVFGPTNQRNFSKKINKQLILPALLAVLASKARRGEVIDIKSTPDNLIKTKAWLRVLGGSLDQQSNLLVMPKHQSDVVKAVRNISYIKLTTASELNALSAATARRIIFLPDALAALQERIQ